MFFLLQMLYIIISTSNKWLTWILEAEIPAAFQKEFIEFVCRLAKLTNKTLEQNDVQWHSAIGFLQQNFPQYVPNNVFGYYGETSVCLPKLFVVWGEHSWEFTFALISINFVCFMFIAISYVIIYKWSTNRFARILNKHQAKRDLTMQRRIVRITTTDFLCWIPICVMVFLSLIGVYIANIAYIVCACVLLPINSAFNPFLYSSLPDKMLRFFTGTQRFVSNGLSHSKQETNLSENIYQSNKKDSLNDREWNLFFHSVYLYCFLLSVGYMA